MVITDYIDKNARLYPNKAAIKVIGDRSCTWSELRDRVYRVAGGLIQAGLQKGDRVVALAENCFEFPEFYFGTAKAGGIFVPVNFRLAAAEISALIRDAEASVVIFMSKYAETIEAMRKELPSVKRYIRIGGDPGEAVCYEAMVANASSGDPGIEVIEDDIFCLVHTGGTTGAPKLTMLTYRQLAHCATVWIVETGVSYNDVFMIVTPLFHISANWFLLFNVMLGNTVVLAQRFEVTEILRAVEENKVSATTWVSQLVSSIVSHPDFEMGRYDLRSLRIVATGAAVLPIPHLRKLVEKLPGVRVTNQAGQTEYGIGTGIWYGEFLDKTTEKLLSAGKEAFGMEIKIVDENDNELPAGEIGELCFRGESVMKGYWNRPEETAEALRSGWGHSGDLCKIDEDGYLYYVDRKKDMIKTGGENVYCKEVEDVLYTHQAISEAAVIGVPDDKWGEAVKALIVVKDGQKVTEEEIVSACRKHLAGFKCPKSIEFRASLLRTSLGKIDKQALRKPYWSGLGRSL